MAERFDLTALYPQHEGEDDGAWTNRVLSHAREHGTNRQCSIGWHEECSDPQGLDCYCLCHDPEVQEWSVEGHPEGGGQVITRVEEGRVRMPPQAGEPEGTWATWILGRNETDAAERAIKEWEAKHA
jgi:hypothetical protein